MTTTTTEETIKAMVKAGGSEWQKSGMHRVYFNNLLGWYGVEVNRYNTGNISSASLDGKGISNSLARHIETSLAGGKVWFDVQANRWMGKGLEQGDLDKLVAAIKARVAEVAHS